MINNIFKIIINKLGNSILLILILVISVSATALIKQTSINNKYLPTVLSNDKGKDMLPSFDKFLNTVMTSSRNSKESKNPTENIAAKIIRFHVIANSDSKEDQVLKYIVKDSLVHTLTPLLNEATDIMEARDIISNNMELIHETAIAAIHQEGSSYPVTVSLGSTYFPLKRYGELFFPPGYYEALRVQIGRSQGENWWCVMFPPLCLVDETYSIVDEESDTKLRTLLTEEEYDILKAQKVPVKIKFKLIEAIKKLLA